MEMNFEKITKKKDDSFGGKGYLGATADDHERIYSTPDERLIKNPGKSLGEIMSDEELHENIALQLEFFKEQDSSEIEKEHWQDFVTSRKIDFINSLRYLEKIGRLPKEIDVDYLEEIIR